MLSKNLNPLSRFEMLLSDLPKGCIFDGEIVVLDDAGRPQCNALMFGRRAPVYVAFDVLYADGQDLRAKPLRARKAMLKKLLGGRHDLIVIDGIAGQGTRLFQAVCELDLEGIVAKRIADPYAPETKWFKIPNRSYTQKDGRAELFQRH
jgi:bifunctional non-homologous end joining protein LigD